MELSGATIDRRFVIERSVNSSQSVYLARDIKTKKRVAVCFSGTVHDLKSSYLVKIIKTGNFAGQDYFVREWVTGTPLDEKIASGVTYPEFAAVMMNVFKFLITINISLDIQPNQIIVLPNNKIKILKIDQGNSFHSLASIYFYGLVGDGYKDNVGVPSVANPLVKSDKDIKDFRLVDQLFKNTLLELKPLSELKKDLVKTSKTLLKNKRRPKIIAVALLLAVVGLGAYFVLNKEEEAKIAVKQQLVAPRVVGLNKKQAREILKEKGISFVFKINNKEAIKISKQIPPPGANISGAMTLFVGQKKVRKIKIPDLKGMNRERARQILQEMGLVAFYERIPADFRAGLVLKTKPKAGSFVEKDGAVTLFVAAPNGLPKIPDIVGKKIEAARDLAFKKGVGLRIFEKVFTSQYPEGEVIKQYPLPGARPISKTVKAWVAYPEPAVAMPEVVGLTVSEAKNIFNDLGLSYSIFETPGAPRNFIAKQSPKPGQPLPDKIVRIWIYR